MEEFLVNKLKLNMHPDKVYIKTLASGVDFLGWVNFFDHRIVRKITKLRAVKNIEKESTNYATISSYFGLFKHGNTHKVKENILERLCR